MRPESQCCWCCCMYARQAVTSQCLHCLRVVFTSCCSWHQAVQRLFECVSRQNAQFLNSILHSKADTQSTRLESRSKLP